MNEQFYDLPQEKQLRIINAGLEVFAKNDYKHAVTDEIARKAGISKGLLFYYFHNKKSLYLYLFDYCADLIIGRIMGEDEESAKWKDITDFFELMEYAAETKMKVLEKTPYLGEFVMRCYYSDDNGLGEELNRKAIAAATMAMQKYYKNIDYSKFKPDVPPQEVYDMLRWMTEGYLFDRRSSDVAVSMKEVMDKFYIWKRRLKQIAYKEEYQDEEAKG